MKKHYVIFLLFILFCLPSCTTSTYMFMGNNLYKEGKLYKSCDKYVMAYKKCGQSDVKNRGDIAEKIGDIYNSINNNRRAYLWYKKSLLSKDKIDIRIQKVLNLAYRMGRKSDVIKLKNKYGVELNNLNLFVSDNRYDLFPFEPTNSRNDDFGLSFRGNDTTLLYFSSNRKLKKKIKQKKSPIDNKYNSNIYVTEFTDEVKNNKSKSEAVKYLGQAKWIKARILKDSLVNTSESEGVLCFDESGKKVYFTSSRRENGVHVAAKIFSADVDEDGKFTHVKKLEIVDDTIAVGHPAISSDGTKLYFASRMDGGFGKSDIWYCFKSGKKWSRPINAGAEINTTGNEMYPSFNSQDDLFIASDGHKGYGGLDIFAVTGVYGHYSLRNLGFPFNTNADDFGIIYYPGLDKGFFTSSRNKKSIDNIYYFAIHPLEFIIEIMLIDKRNGLPLENATIRMIDTNGQTYTLKTDKDGHAELGWKHRGRANFNVQADGYLRESFVLDTRDVIEDSQFVKELAFNRMNSVVEVPNIFYKSGKAKLTNDSKESLKALVAILNDNPSVTIVLGSHTDMIGDADANISLSEDRAKSVVDFLIDNGVSAKRLTTEGFGELLPRIISKEEASDFPFLKLGQKLSPAFIITLSPSEANIANKLNRRTEFRVLRTDYIHENENK